MPISQELAAAADYVAELRRLAALPAAVDGGSGAQLFRDMAAIRRKLMDVRSIMVP